MQSVCLAGNARLLQDREAAASKGAAVEIRSEISSWGMLRPAAWYNQVRYQYLYNLAVLIERGRPYLHQPLLRAQLRWTHVDDLALDSQLVSRAHRMRPS